MDIPASERLVIACLGSSSTRGKGQAFDWISNLKTRPANARCEFTNLGVGGDLAYNSLQRLAAVISCRPRKVIVWTGGNDVLAQVFRNYYRFIVLTKHPPRTPSPEWFRECLDAIVHRLKRETAADIGLCSLPPIGEAPDSFDPTQAALNRLIEEYSRIISAIAHDQQCRYFALREAILEQLRVSPGRAFTSFRFLPFYRDAFRALVLRQSPDQIGEKNGWRFHSDGLHLNGRAGLIVADLLQSFIET